MRDGFPWGVLIALVAAGLVASSVGGDEVSSGAGTAPSGGNDARDEVRGFVAELELPSSWATFLLAYAHHESRWKPLVALGDVELSEVPDDVKLNTGPVGTAEAKAGLKSWDRNNKFYGTCAWSKNRYAYSGGLYGLLPAVGLYAFRKTQDVCIDPWAVFDVRVSTVMIVDYMWRTRWNFKGAFEGGGGTWRALNRAGGAPGFMDNIREGTERRWERALKALGVPVSWGDQRVQPIKGWNPIEALAIARGGANA